MKQLFPRGKRIRPTDKDLVFHTALAALFPVFLLVVLLFHIRQIAGTDWQEVSLSQIVQDVNIPYLLFSMGVAGLVCLTAVLLFWRYRRDEVKQLIHRQKLARMVLENKWYESEQRKEDAFFKDLSSSRSKETITYFPKIYYRMKQGLLHIRVEITLGKYQEQLLNLEKKLESGLYCELTDKELKDSYVEYTLLYDTIANRISIEDVQAKDGRLRLMENVWWEYDKLPHMLIAGGTGGGKTYFILTLIEALLRTNAVLSVLDPKNADLADLQAVMPDVYYKKEEMPADQIAFIHEANTEVRKKELFSKVRTGQVRVLMGSTAKMGAGTNVQDRLVALHDLDCPWRPGDLAQRKGRIERQGNQNPLVHVYRYVTEGTFDAYLWQTVENKQKFISQIMTSKSPVRSCDDVDETALSFAEIKALCAGDPRIKERMDLDVEVSRLKLMKADHQSKQYRLEDQLLKYFPEEIEKHKGFIKGFESDLEVLAAHPHPEDGFAGMEIRGDLLTDKENAGAALLDACKEVKTSDPVQIGSYRGYAMSVEFSAWKQEYTLLLKGQMTHRATLGTDPRGNLTRIDNALAQMPQRLEAAKAQLDNLYQQQAAAKEEVGKPFLYEEELRSKNARLVELDTLLNIDGKGQAHAEAVVAKSARPSVLDHLKRPVPPRSTDKKPKQHEEVR